MAGETLQTQVDEIRTLMEKHLRIRGRTLDIQLRKAGRALPRGVRRDAHYLDQAAMLSRNPKLARMVDEAKARKAFEVVAAHLKAIDPVDRLKGRVLGVLASISVVLIVVFVAVVWVLVNRGYV